MHALAFFGTALLAHCLGRGLEKAKRHALGIGIQSRKRPAECKGLVPAETYAFGHHRPPKRHHRRAIDFDCLCHIR